MIKKIGVLVVVLLMLSVGLRFLRAQTSQKAPARPPMTRFNQVEARILQVFSQSPSGKSDAIMALAISRAENDTRRCDRPSMIINPDRSRDWGVFQINDKHRRRFSDLDFTKCEDNIQAAYRLFREEGWTPWSAYNNGSYRKFLPHYKQYVLAQANSSDPRSIPQVQDTPISQVSSAAQSTAQRASRVVRDFVILMSD